MAYYFKVKIGFDKNDVIEITDAELGIALRAQVSGRVAIFRGGTVAGNNIISILPDWNKELGLNRSYQLTDEDFRQIGKKKINEYREVFAGETKKLGVGNDKKLLSKG